MLKTILLYSLLLILGLAGLEWLKRSFFLGTLSIEWYMGIVAILFLILGFFLSKNFKNKKEKEIVEKCDPKEYGISKREMEVLNLMAKGMSNEEIADSLFLSISTVKTHGYNLFKKLDVSRRTMAIAKAKEIKLIN